MEIKLINCFSCVIPTINFQRLKILLVSLLFFIVKYMFLKQFVKLLMVKYTYLLTWLLFDFFSFSWSRTICFFVALYSWVCSCPKISFCNQPVLILQSTCFICTTWKRKQTVEQQPNRACERTKSKQKQKQVT